MNYFKNERGYALYITLAILILFTALGMTILALTSNGMKKNENRKETIQATAQAEKGIERIVSEINTELTIFLGDNGETRTKFENKLNLILDSYPCPPDDKIKNQENLIEKYEVCIRNHNPIEGNGSRQLVKFESTGYAGVSENIKLYTDIEIGAEAYPTNLKYVLSANATPGSSKPDEGNLMFHGGSDITGNIKVDGNLFVYYIATDVKLNRFDSTHPNLLVPKAGDPPPNIFLAKDKNLYTIELKSNIKDIDWKNGYNKHLENPFLYTPHPKLGDPSKNLFLSSPKPTIKNTNEMNSYFDVQSQFIPENFGKTAVLDAKGQYRIKEGTFINEDGILIDGDLLIGNQDVNPSSPASAKKNVSLRGKMYVNGDVKIKGVNLDSDVILFVNGKVDISFADIPSRNSINKSGTLFIFSTKAITMSDICTGCDKPSILKGFFYSQDNFEVHARASHIEIQGGISARRIVLNAVRNTNGFGEYDKRTPSRLIVKYDGDLINNYRDLNKSFSFINKVDQPFEINRKTEKFIKK